MLVRHDVADFATNGVRVNADEPAIATKRSRDKLALS
jgi:hypothetical protein